MNTIEAITDKSDYEIYEDFLNFRIDGYWLDETLDEIYPSSSYKGLVPTLSYWMEREDEKAVVWKRILPDENETAVCPVLMCPDDNDFWCTLVVAEIRNCGSIVQWKRMGLNRTEDWEAEKVGTTVEWFDKLNELNFTKENYLRMLDVFRERLMVDKSKMEEGLKNRNEKEGKS